MVNNIFAALYYSDRELHRFNAIGVTPKELSRKNYFELQTMFLQIPRENLEQYCKTFQTEAFWKDMTPAEKALKNLMYPWPSIRIIPTRTGQGRQRIQDEQLGQHVLRIRRRLRKEIKRPIKS